MRADLSGRWSGIFNYPRSNPPTAFEAEIADRGGAFVGTVQEPDLFSTPPGAPIAASLDGTHDGTTVQFTKFYDEGEGDYDTVAYQGALNAEGTEISGGWSIPGVWSGTFLMLRRTGVEQDAELEAEAERELDGAPPTVPTGDRAPGPMPRPVPDRD